MYQIAPLPAPVWRDYAPGIRIQLRFGPTEARASAQRYVRGVLEADPSADFFFAFAVGCILWGAVAWEGVGAPAEPVEGDAQPDPDSPVVPAELNAEMLTLLLQQRPDIFDDLETFYVGTIINALLEKNGSGPSPSGISEAAPATAPDATGPVA